MANVKFGIFLGIFSILGFLSILLNLVLNINVDAWVEATLFLLMGVALAISGGIKSFIEYFKNGLTSNEITKIATILIGLFSIVVGVSILPAVGWSSPLFDGWKAIIASLAILIIIAEIIVEGGK